jgi:hypothetical protein
VEGEQYCKWGCVRFVGSQVVDYLGVGTKWGWDIEECHEERVRPGSDEGAIGDVRTVDQLYLLGVDAGLSQRRCECRRGSGVVY